MTEMVKSMKLPIYLDYQATTPMDPRVLEAMLPYYKEYFGNAASRHHPFGLKAKQAVEDARAKIASFINAEDPEEIIFTSGATESNNFAIRGIAEMYREKGNHMITVATEHKSVLSVCQHLEEKGFKVTYLPVDREGLINLCELKTAITGNTILISVMHANNEIGVIQPIAEIGEMAKAAGIFFHCDAVQSAGKIPFDVRAAGIHLASISAHKMYGPKGIGALYVRKQNPRVRLAPLVYGGGQEMNLRGGTLNVPAIVGFGEAVRIAKTEMAEEAKRVLGLRTELHSMICKGLDCVDLHGSLEKRLPGNLNVSFEFIEGELLFKLINQELAVSSGSACSSTSLEPSYVLKALGVRESLIHTSVRFSLGRFTTSEEIDYAANKIVSVVQELREKSPFYKK